MGGGRGRSTRGGRLKTVENYRLYATTAFDRAKLAVLSNERGSRTDGQVCPLTAYHLGPSSDEPEHLYRLARTLESGVWLGDLHAMGQTAEADKSGTYGQHW